MKLFTSLMAFAAMHMSLTTAMAPCLNDGVDEDHLNISSRSAIESRNAHLNRRADIVIDLWLHLLVPGRTAAEGYVDAVGLIQQYEYLNRQFAPWGIKFQLKPISYALNAEWAKDIDVQKKEKMRQLHRGDYKSLNVYLVNGAGGGVCSLPLAGDAPVTQEQLDGDGCFIPLKSGISPNEGTMTHEIGHWLGLYHVFQGGCGGTDYCDDTAPQNVPSYSKQGPSGGLKSCPAKDTCPNLPGSDNVLNFMDYTDCSSEFTACQGGRMVQAFQSYRANRAIAAGVRWK